jgi:hypothetical protein
LDGVNAALQFANPIARFSRSPYVAAYFGATHTPGSPADFCIYALDIVVLQDVASRSVGAQ